MAAALVFSGGSNRGGSTSKIPQVVNRIHFLAAVAFLKIGFFKASNGREFLLRDVSCFSEDLGLCERLIYNQAHAAWYTLISSVS